MVATALRSAPSSLERTEPSVGPRRERPVLAALLLAAVYVLASLLLDPGGYLGTDTGAKVATLDHMSETGSWRPLVPYWAEDLDPEGLVHPLYQTQRVEDGWVNVTTLPMLLAARPLYDLGGYRLTLVLPMAGAVAAALAARALARRLAGPQAGRRAFWAVGLLSPLAVYALDLWEHSIGVACTLWALALLAGIVDRTAGSSRAVALRALGAGALFGLAASMRTEAFVYAFVAVGACGLALLLDRRVVAALQAGGAAVVGFAGPWLGNRALESALGGTNRSARAEGAARGALDELGDRAYEAVATLLAPRAASGSTVLLVGLVMACLLAAAVGAERAGRRDRALLCVGGTLVVQLLLLARGLGFVPGMLAATPIAVVGLVTRPVGRAATYLLAVALGALPLVWAFQYVGGALPQWGGRYILGSGAILLVLGVVALPQLGRPVVLGVVGLAALVTASGVAWQVERSHEVDRWFRAAVDRPEDVLIVRNAFFVREGGAASTERRWLSAPNDDDVDLAIAIVEDAGLASFAVVDRRPEAPELLAGATLVTTDRTEVYGQPLYVHSYLLP